MRTIPSRLGPLALEERLGHSEHCHTYRAVHIERRVSLAVRILPHGALAGLAAAQAFLENIAELKPLVHENIVRCLGGAVDEGWPYVVFEYVRGESLTAQLDRRGKLPWEGVVDIAQGICRGLAHIHAQNLSQNQAEPLSRPGGNEAANRLGIGSKNLSRNQAEPLSRPGGNEATNRFGIGCKCFLHARLSSEKILLDESGTVKLAGLATARIERHEALIRSGLDVQQAAYLAPEQLEGGVAATVQSDLHAVGCLLFQMLTGRLPYTANSVAELAAIKRTTAAPNVTSLEMTCPIWLDVLVDRLLAPAPKDRPASANDVLDALAETKRVVASGMGTAQRALSRKKSALVRRGNVEDQQELARIRRQRSCRRDDSPFYERVWFLAVCLAALVAGAIWLLWPPGEEVLFEKAAVLMASDDVADWYRAESDYLLPLREQFPNGQHTAEVTEFLNQIEMDRAMKKLRLNTQLGRPRSCEGERLFARAWEYEQFGDRVTALTRYQALIHLLTESDEVADGPYVNLARQRIRDILQQQGNSGESQREFVERHLNRADELASAGKTLAARRIWESVVALYDGNRELATLVDRARDRIATQNPQM